MIKQKQLKQNTSKKINTHNLVVNFGRYKDERWTRIPLSYLRWLINEGTQYSDIAKAELDRRGYSLSANKDIELSGHAIDKASLRLRRLWHQTAKSNNEGLFTWLERMATEAFDLLPKDSNEIVHKKIKFIFMRGEIYPVLKTVMPTPTIKYKEIQSAGKKLLEAYFRGLYIQFAVDDKEISIYLIQSRKGAYSKHKNLERLLDVIEADFNGRKIKSVAPLSPDLRELLEKRGIKNANY